MFESRDHPRSRGVYSAFSASSRDCRGSSPLARGLQGIRLRAIALRGIIPARAGFTTACRYGSRTCRDHPRSRGVYRRPSPHLRGCLGSSPLARGLRHGGRPAARRTGIIPARAGFTRVQPAHLRQQGDHPRSRGVYRVIVASADHPDGSSPLARGLLAGEDANRTGCGIIPARAGFTEPWVVRRKAA